MKSIVSSDVREITNCEEKEEEEEEEEEEEGIHKSHSSIQQHDSRAWDGSHKMADTCLPSQST
jgi:ABC-type Zn2+ transport system substrate-binding protein/surface adhesin